MSNIPSTMRKSLLGAASLAALCLTAGPAQALTPFQQDVTTSIDRGIEWLANNGAFTDPSSAGDAAGLPMQALLEKRASGNPGDPPQGYNGASATDKARLRTAAANILNRVNETGFYAYRDGQFMFALAGYALTGGPDRSVLGVPAPNYQDIKAAMDALVDRTLANQNAAGYWCYSNGGCNDSSTTQFAAAGLHAAKTFYSSPASGDQVYADPARVALIDAALLKANQAYVNNAAGTGSDNGSCNVLTATERGHGYHPANEGYKPSLQQTASGIYIQMFGGANVNTPMVQNYMQWVRNRYRYSDLDSMGNSWAGPSWSYYMWSSFKGMEVIRQSGVAPSLGNLGPNDYGTLPALSAPACAFREENKLPAVVARPASFGAGGVGYYAGETKGQYFDYAHTILDRQCYDGSLPITGNDGYYGCNGTPGPWNSYAHQAYLLLVLQRSVGNVVQACDVNGDFVVDKNDINLIRAAIGQTPTAGDPRDVNLDGKITINDVRACVLKCTHPSCATN